MLLEIKDSGLQAMENKKNNLKMRNSWIYPNIIKDLISIRYIVFQINVKRMNEA